MALTKISTAMISQSAAAVDLNVDAGTFYVDTTNNRVGVGGKTDPDTPLHVIGTVTATTFAGSGASLTNIPNSALTNSSITINSNAVSLGGSLTLTTANIGENTNLYFTNARADARADARITATLIDEDDMSSNSATRLPSQQSVKAYVDSEVAGLVDSAPGTLNTLNELAAALGDDASFSTTVTNSIATKMPLSGGTFTGAITANSGITVDNLTIDGYTISSDTSLILDIAGNLTVDVDGTTVTFSDGGTTFGQFFNTGAGVFNLLSPQSNQDMVFRGVDGGTNIIALTLDMSNNGRALFNHGATFDSNVRVYGNAGASIDWGDTSTLGQLTFDGSGNPVIRSSVSNKSLVIQGVDAGASINALTLDMANAGAATFSASVTTTSVNASDYIQAKADDAEFYLTNAANTNYYRLKRTGASGDFIIDHYNGSSTTERFRIRADGNVGIGTDSPAATLEVENSSGATIMVDDTNGRFIKIRSGNSGSQNANISSYSGLYLGGADNASHMLIANNGNVGIGAASPGCALDIERSSGWAEVHLNGASGGDLILQDNGVNYGEIYAGNGHGMVLKAHSGQHMYFLTNGAATAKAVITTTGNVGIGTTNPGSKLTVEGDIRQTAGDLLYQGGGNWDIKHLADNQNILFYTSQSGSATEKMRIRADGNVGVGTDSPSEKLHVNGIIASQNSTQGTGLLQLQGYGNSGFINNTGSSSLFFRMGSSFTTRMTLTSGGNLGVGESNPTSRIHTDGTILVDKDHAGIVFTPTGEGSSTNSDYMSALLRAEQAGYHVTSNNGGFNSTAESLNLMNHGDLILATAPKTGGSTNYPSGRVIIKTSGNVGIGTNSPTSVLHVSATPASGYPLAEISNTSNTTATSYGLSVQGGGNSSGAGYQFQTKDMDGNVDFFIRGNGDIGIGTASPQRDLDVRHALNIFGTGGYTELMLRGRAGTAQNLGAFHWSIRGDVGGNNDDLKLLRFTGGNSPTYAGTSLQIRNDNGFVGIGTNTGQADGQLEIRENGGDHPTVKIRRGLDGGRVQFAYAGNTSGFGEIGQTYYGTGRTRIWMGANLESFSTGHSGPTQQDSNYASWFSTWDSYADEFTINRIASGTTSEIVTVTSSGRLGINRSSPDYPLHLINPSDSNQMFRVLFPDAYYTEIGTSRMSTGHTQGLYINAQTNIKFGSGSTETARLTNGGNFGLGTDDPEGRLHVKKGAFGGSYSPDGADQLILENSDSVAIDLRTPNGNSGVILFSDSDARARGVIQYAHSNDTMYFNTANATRMMIEGSGNVILGEGPVTTTTVDTNGVVSNTSGTWSWSTKNVATSGSIYGNLVHFTGQDPNNTSSLFFAGVSSAGTRYAVYSNGNVVNSNNSYGSTSDLKLKENIEDASSQWRDIKAIRVRKYSMKEEESSSPTQIGVIAQEVESAGMSGLVYESPDRDIDTGEISGSTKHVKYSILYMKAIKALQEAMTRIEILEAKVAALEKSN